MVKQRITLLDAVCIVRELRQRLVGLRVSNIYNLDPNSTFLLKMAGLPVSTIVRREKALLGEPTDGEASGVSNEAGADAEAAEEGPATEAAPPPTTPNLEPQVSGPVDTMSGKGLERTKELLLLESGCRLHLTRFERDKVCLLHLLSSSRLESIHFSSPFPP